MRQTYILDTSVLVDDPCAYKFFKYSDVIIPITVINELDKVKTHPGQAGRNARVAIKLLDQISNLGDISAGVLIENDILVSVDSTYRDMRDDCYSGFGDPSLGDTHILACAVDLDKNAEREINLVSNDLNLRLKAKARSISAEAYESNKFDINELFSGSTVLTNEVVGLELQKNNHINPKTYDLDLSIHEFITFLNDNGDVLASGRKVSPEKIKLTKKQYPWSITPRNKEQLFATDLIMDKGLDLITMVGKAGTGKTLISLACALDLVINRKEYNKLVIYRPIQAVGNDIGYTPGPQPMDAKIATPNGWTTMGELKIDDYVISEDGTPSKVLKIFPKGKKEVFKITTTDGTSTEACADHLWAVKTLYDREVNADYRIVSTKSMQNNLKSGGANNYQLPRNGAVQYSKKELPIPPYSFGAYLGDGSATGDHFAIYSKDAEIINRVEKELICFGVHLSNNGSNKLSNRFFPNKQFGKAGAQFVLATSIIDNSSIEFNSISSAAEYFCMRPSSISTLCKNKKISKKYKFEYLDKKMNSSHPLISKLKDMGLHGKRAWEKYIPDIYKYSSVEDRINLLRGLMDTDGSIKKNGECSYTTTSLQLANDIVELIKSLGGRATVLSRNRVGKKNKIKDIDITVETKRISYEFTISMPNNINPFHLSRKKDRFNENKVITPISIKSIESVGEKEVQCILIENPRHLYLTDNFIVTHNTIEEKLAPWFQAIIDNFETLFTSKNGGDWKRDLEMYQKKGKIEMNAITYIRGRSITNAIMFIDEVQNISKEEIKTILTRAGENTKIILTGDIDQIDNSLLDATNNGLTYVIEKFKDSEIAGHITFTQGERSRLATLASEIL